MHALCHGKMRKALKIGWVMGVGRLTPIMADRSLW